MENNHVSTITSQRKKISSTKDSGNPFRNLRWNRLDCLERPLSRFFEEYGRLVSRHPWPFVLFPIIVSFGLSIGFLHRDEITDATYLYTPIGAYSKMERQSIHEKWPMINGNFYPGKSVTQLRECQSIVSSRDGGNVLRPEIASAINRLNLFITDRIKVIYNNVTYRYLDLCLLTSDNVCSTNQQVGLVNTFYSNPMPSLFNLTFPMAYFGVTPVYLASSLGGVKVDPISKHIISADAWLLLYQLQFTPDNNSYVSGLWEKQFQHELLNYADPFIKLTVMHSQTLSEELKKNAEHLAPRFVVSFILLLVFATLCTTATVKGAGFPYVDWVLSKPFLAMAGVAGAGLGVASAIGFLNFCGYYYNQIVLVMPFLVVSVRLDNTFLMISAVRHTSRTLSVEQRMGQAMAEAAVSITVTVLTDLLSFSTGLFANIPAVIIFSWYTVIAILLSFIYQLTFLMGILVLSLRLEEHSKHAVFLAVKTVPPIEAGSHNVFVRLFCLGSRPNFNKTGKNADGVDMDFMSRMFRKWYGPVLMHPIMRVVVMIWFGLYLGLAGWACSLVQQGLEPVNLLVSNSYAIPHYRALERYFWKYGSEAQICVNNAPNLANKTEMEKLQQVVLKFANSTHSIGEDGVQFWLKEYQIFLTTMKLPNISELSSVDFYLSVYHFLSLNTNQRFRLDVKWNTDMDPDLFYDNYTGPVPNMSAFRFTIGLKYFQTAQNQIDTVDSLRALAQQYSEYNITTFHPIWLFVDQYEQIWPNVYQEIIGGTCFMILIALLLIPHPICSLWVAVVILSVDLGVIGFMTVWGIRLDTVSMITIIMSIGFSVDFAAHIAHAFVVSGEASPVQRACDALGSIGWPSLQGGMSTILGVCVLANVGSYMIVAFFKTVFLVIVLALLHGLVFLPVLLSIFVPHSCKVSNIFKKKQRTTNSSNLAV